VAKKTYSTSLVFFHGSPSTPIIGALWAPHTATVRPWKVNLPYSTIPVPGCEKHGKSAENDEEGAEIGEPQGALVINKPAILNEIARLGGDLVEWIQVNR